jgi:hypothetical protein
MIRLASSLILGSVVLVSGLVQAQQVRNAPPPTARPEYGTFFLNTNVGTFKIKSPGDQQRGNKWEFVKAEGTVTMNFTGTVLISGLEGNVNPGAGVRKEKELKDFDKVLYNGTGRMQISGKFRSIQFFGRNLRMTFNGMGAIFISGEFDRNLSTGEYWFAENPQRMPLMSGGMTLMNPPARAVNQRPVPRVRDN